MNYVNCALLVVVLVLVVMCCMNKTNEGFADDVYRSLCLNRTDWRQIRGKMWKRGKVNGNVYDRRDCNWVSKNPKKRCGKQGFNYQDTDHFGLKLVDATTSCPVACGRCRNGEKRTVS